MFRDDEYGLWAALLVTHYRHNHIAYFDRTWRNRNYARLVPDYLKGHDAFRAIVNNRGKRVLIRLMLKRWSPKRTKPLLRGFARLRFNDDKTRALITKSLTRLYGTRPLESFAGAGVTPIQCQGPGADATSAGTTPGGSARGRSRSCIGSSGGGE